MDRMWIWILEWIAYRYGYRFDMDMDVELNVMYTHEVEAATLS